MTEQSASPTSVSSDNEEQRPSISHKVLQVLGIKKKKRQKPRSKAREWADAILFAVVAATIIRWLFLEAYTIPTPSMERSLLVGDFLFVSKVHYGARTPATPLQIPLTHQKIWGTSYLDWIQLPQYRLPGISEVKRNDVVVFNWPVDFSYPVDLKTNYIKRCVGLPGDTLQIKDMVVYINGEAQPQPAGAQFRYYARTNQIINKRIWEKYRINEHHKVQGGYLVFTTPAIAKELEQLQFINSVEVIKEQPDYADRGDSTLVIDGTPYTTYTFKQNYYFMMGDNRHNSLDSRFWGFVPHDHIVGKALFIWMSIDPQESLFRKIRWNRLFKGIH